MIVAAASASFEINWVAVGVVGLALYIIDCWLRPIVRCRACGGSGKWLRSGRRMAPCPRCKRKGEHVRFGRRLFTLARKGR